MLFDTKDNDDATQEAPSVRPWKSLRLDLECGGHWVLAGDVDGDGEVEIVSAQNVDHEDVHYTSSVAAQKLDGTVLWRWGNPNLGQRTWQYDVACQIHDWDGDGCIYAYNFDGNLLWEVHEPGGYRTAHQLRPVDLDGDGHDEIMAGYALLNSDGSVR